MLPVRVYRSAAARLGRQSLRALIERMRGRFVGCGELAGPRSGQYNQTALRIPHVRTLL